jgi:hypothetical protein
VLADPALEERLMEAYAKSLGHESDRSWILLVHPDSSTDFFEFEDPTSMWCCRQGPEIRSRILAELGHSD